MYTIKSITIHVLPRTCKHRLLLFPESPRRQTQRTRRLLPSVNPVYIPRTHGKSFQQNRSFTPNTPPLIIPSARLPVHPPWLTWSPMPLNSLVTECHTRRPHVPPATWHNLILDLFVCFLVIAWSPLIFSQEEARTSLLPLLTRRKCLWTGASRRRRSRRFCNLYKPSASQSVTHRAIGKINYDLIKCICQTQIIQNDQ